MAVSRRKVLVQCLIVATILFAQRAISESTDERPSVTAPRALVIGPTSLKETHRKLVATVEEASREMTWMTSDEKAIALQQDGEYIYDAIVFLDPSASLATALPIHRVKRFLADGKTIFVTASLNPSSYMSSLAAAIGVDISRKPLVDHVSVHSQLDDGTHTYVVAGGNVKSEQLLGSAAASSGDIVFHGAGATLLKDNELVKPIIWGSGSAHTQESRTGAPRVAGSASVIAAAVSTRRGGKAAYFGSLLVMSDETIGAAGERHGIAVTSFVRWTLSGSGMLHVGRIKHWNEDDVERRDSTYRVGDRIGVSVDVFEWRTEQKEWLPFSADDMQLELSMLDPYVRAPLRDAGNGTYSASVVAPNQIGVYKFVVEYHRPGLSGISKMEVVPVRPLLHNEYERFIPMAVPYYVASFSVIVCTYVLGLVLVFGNEAAAPKPLEKEA